MNYVKKLIADLRVIKKCPHCEGAGCDKCNNKGILDWGYSSDKYISEYVNKRLCFYHHLTY